MELGQVCKTQRVVWNIYSVINACYTCSGNIMGLCQRLMYFNNFCSHSREARVHKSPYLQLIVLIKILLLGYQINANSVKEFFSETTYFLVSRTPFYLNISLLSIPCWQSVFLINGTTEYSICRCRFCFVCFCSFNSYAFGLNGRKALSIGF